MESPVRIFIADDHTFALAGVRIKIERAGEMFQVAGEASNAAETLNLLATSRPGDLLVTDFSMKGPESRNCDGLPFLLTMRRNFPALPIIVITEVENPALLRAIVDAGVKGVISKASACGELLTAIRKVVAGRVHCCPVMRFLLEQTGEIGRSQGCLSPCEAEVVRLFVGGLTVSAIALRLSRSVKTISRQKSDAMRKLGLDNNCQLYAYARDHCLAS